MSNLPSSSETQTETPVSTRIETPVGAYCTSDMTATYETLSTLVNTPTITVAQVASLTDVVLSDQLDELSMFCYTRDCDIENCDNTTKDCRGIVFDSVGKLISRSFGYTPMYSTDGSFTSVPIDIKEFISDHIAECKFYPSLEGALVRAFNHNDKWYLTTHRKLDAFKSRWGTRTSFAEMFVNALPRVESPESGTVESPQDILNNFFSKLNKARQYMFLVVNTLENRIVCMNENVPRLIQISTTENGVQVDDIVPDIHSQVQVEVSSYDNLIEIVNGCNPYMYQGIIVFMPNGKQVKLCNNQYLSLFHLRGNEASIMFRYLQIRNTHGEHFRLLYPECAQKFTHYENVIMEIARSIFSAYRNRFILRKNVILPQEEFKVMSATHSMFKSLRSSDSSFKVSVETVLSILNAQHPTAINKMIRRVVKEAQTE